MARALSTLLRKAVAQRLRRAPPPKKRTIIVHVLGCDATQAQIMDTVSFLKHRRFDPELIDSMSVAYASVCQALGLNTKSNQATETIAPKIIDIATRGARSPTEIHLLAMEELRAKSRAS